jgi:hypothetical protein
LTPVGYKEMIGACRRGGPLAPPLLLWVVACIPPPPDPVLRPRGAAGFAPVTAGDRQRELGALGGSRSQAFAVNARGQVVG